MGKKRKKKKPQDAGTRTKTRTKKTETGRQYHEVFSPPPAQWLPKFLGVITCGFFALALGMWVYNWYWSSTIIAPAKALLQKHTDESARQAFLLLSRTHIFSGLMPYQGFAQPQVQKECKQIEQIVQQGREYSIKEKERLNKRQSCWIPAFKKYKLNGDAKILEGDWTVLQALLTRADNATHTGFVYAGYATVVGVLLCILFFVYRKFGLHLRVGTEMEQN